MCGLIGGALPLAKVEDSLPLIAHRGPDDSGAAALGGFALGHTRLAIQDVAGAPRQPVVTGDLVVTYNGEIWAPEALRIALDHAEWSSTGDTEAVAVALQSAGWHALKAFRGMWALAWTDGWNAYLARDAYGEVPLHFGITPDRRVVWASEIIALIGLGAVPASIQWVPPGHVVTLSASSIVSIDQWDDPHDLSPSEELPNLRELLRAGTVNRMRSDVPVAVLCSGGLDSSAILTLLVEAGYTPTTYTAVLDPRSADRKHARIVTQQLGLELVEVPIPAPTHHDLQMAVAASEMPHKAQIEITHACLTLARQISADGFKVVLSGEGSDELWASYGMSFHGIRAHGWHRYRYELFTGQHRKNFARTNKVFMRYGVEARLPFLEPALVRAALRMTQAQVTQNGTHPKAALAAAFGDELPHASLWRSKAAFQTEAGIDKAAADVIHDPARYYRAEFSREFRGVHA